MLLAPLVLLSLASGCRSGSLSRTAPAKAEESAARQVEGAIPQTVLGRDLSVEELVGAPPAGGHDHHGGHGMPAMSTDPKADASDHPAAHEDRGKPPPAPPSSHDEGHEHGAHP
ncbi:MAG: hypothetical protein RIF41_38590 [Polyangiaceae bacterium]